MDIMREKELAYILKQMGLRQDLLGYKYIIYAVSLVLDDPAKMDHITKEIYPEIAKKFNTTCQRAERAIRHAVESIFDVIPYEMMEAIFGNTVNADKGKVTNAHFIAAMVECMRLIDIPTCYTSMNNIYPVSDHVKEMVKEWSVLNG